MVERRGTADDSSAVPTIAELLTSYRDRTGHSYGDMARKVRDEIQISRLQQLATSPPKEFPKRARTIELLAEILEVPLATIVLAFAAGLGIPVAKSGTTLAVTLPPGTDILTPEDREAIRAITRALVDARGQATPGGTAEQEQPAEPGGQLVDLARPELPDLSQVAARRGDSEGRRLVEDQDRDSEDPS